MFHYLMFGLLALPGTARAHSFSCPGLFENFVHPADAAVEPSVLDHPQVRAIGTGWRFDHLSHGYPPLKTFKVKNRKAFSTARPTDVIDALIKTPGLDYAIVPGLEEFHSTLQQIVDFEHRVNPFAASDYFAYLTVVHGEVAAGETQGLSGLRLDGFHEANRAGEPIDHSYIVSDTLPPTFTTQRFHFNNFDYGKYDLFSELDRQARPYFEASGQPYQVYLTNGYTPYRQTAAEARTHRTFLRLTYSRVQHDTPNATPNPLLPYRRRDREPSTRPATAKFVPSANLSIVDATKLDVIQGQRLGLVMVGDENARAAGFVAKMLENVGKKVEYIVTMRDPNFAANHPVIETYPESVLDPDYDIYVLEENYRNLGAQLAANVHVWDESALGEQLTKTFHDRKQAVDALILVDVGGRALAPSNAQEAPLPEHQIMRSMAQIEKSETPGYVLVLGPGRLPPENSSALMILGGQYEPSKEDRRSVLTAERKYNKKLGLVGDQALNLWLQAMRGEYGPQKFPTLNAQDPPADVRPEHATVLLMPIKESLFKIERPFRLLEFQ